MAIKPKWTRSDEPLPDYCGSDQRSELGMGITDLIGDVRNMEDCLRQIAEGWYIPRRFRWLGKIFHRKTQRQAKLQLKLLKAQRLMRDGKKDEALNLFWNGDNVDDLASWEAIVDPAIPKHMEKYLE